MKPSLPNPEEALASFDADLDEPSAPAGLPSKTVIDLDVTGSQGRRYQGRFLYEVPTLGEIVQVGRLKAVYLPQGSPADVLAATIVDQVCYLQVCVRFDKEFPKPAWWPANVLELRDPTPVSALFGRCLDYEARFHGRDQKPGADPGRPAEAEESARGSEAHVGRKVRPPAERPETLAGHDPRGT